jgi:hypothetical protein
MRIKNKGIVTLGRRGTMEKKCKNCTWYESITSDPAYTGRCEWLKGFPETPFWADGHILEDNLVWPNQGANCKVWEKRESYV